MIVDLYTVETALNFTVHVTVTIICFYSILYPILVLLLNEEQKKNQCRFVYCCFFFPFDFLTVLVAAVEKHLFSRILLFLVE